jgi:hypothetical protein
MVVRYLTSVTVLDVSRHVGEAVPNPLALAVFVPGAFDLMGGRRGSPEKAIREAASRDRSDFARLSPDFSDSGYGPQHTDHGGSADRRRVASRDLCVHEHSSLGCSLRCLRF